MPFFDWSGIQSFTLHPNIGIPSDDTQGLPYLNASPTGFASGAGYRQNVGLVVANGIPATALLSGYVFSANRRWILGRQGAYPLMTGGVATQSNMAAVDRLGSGGHLFAVNGNNEILNNPLIWSGDTVGWQRGPASPNMGAITQTIVNFFNYNGSNYVAFGNGPNFACFKPGGIVNFYNDSGTGTSLNPQSAVNGSPVGYETGSNPAPLHYAFIARMPPRLIYIAPGLIAIPTMSYNFNSAPVFIYILSNGTYMGYDGVGDIASSDSFIPFGDSANTAIAGYNVPENFQWGFDPTSRKLLLLSGNTVSVNGYSFYPVYVSEPLHIVPNYFALQRNFAHNYSRGVPINGGLQNAIIQAPNTNIIL